MEGMHGAVMTRTSPSPCGHPLGDGHQNLHKRAVEFHPGEGAYIKIQPRQNRGSRMATVIGGKADQGRRYKKITRWRQAFYSMLFEIMPTGTGTCADFLEANMARRLHDESENGHLTRSSDSW